MIQFDVLFKDLKEMGLAQVIIVLLLCYQNICGGINALATVFIAYEPDLRCNVPPLDNKTAYPELSEEDILNYTTPYDEASKEYNGCYRYGYDLDQCQGDLNCVNTSHTAIPCDKGYYYDQSLFTETVITEFDLVCDQQYLNTLSTSMYYVGLMIGSILFGNLADLVGRKVCCVATFTASLGCMLGITFSRSIVLYIVFRVGVAGFLYGSTLGTYVCIMEIVGRKWRTLVGIGYQTFFSFGFMIWGGVAYHWRDWHEMMLVGTIISAPYLLFVLFLPESPRWLFTKKKESKGIAVTNKIARINKVQISEKTWAEAKRLGSLQEKTSQTRHSSIDLFRTKGTAVITAKVAFNWFVNSFVYYGISLNAGALAGDIFINNTLNGVFEILAYVFVILVMDRIGRRITLTFLLLLAGVGLLLSVVVNEYAGDNESLITLGLVFAFTAKFGIAGSFSVIYNLTCELYPTVIRSNGVGMGSFAARVGGILAPYMIELQNYVVWLPNTIFGVLSIVGGVLSLSFPETNKQAMMETIEAAERFYRGEKVDINENEESYDVEENMRYAYSNEALDCQKTRI